MGDVVLIGTGGDARRRRRDPMNLSWAPFLAGSHVVCGYLYATARPASIHHEATSAPTTIVVKPANTDNDGDGVPNDVDACPRRRRHRAGRLPAAGHPGHARHARSRRSRRRFPAPQLARRERSRHELRPDRRPEAEVLEGEGDRLRRRLPDPHPDRRPVQLRAEGQGVGLQDQGHRLGDPHAQERVRPGRPARSASAGTPRSPGRSARRSRGPSARRSPSAVRSPRRPRSRSPRGPASASPPTSDRSSSGGGASVYLKSAGGEGRSPDTNESAVRGLRRRARRLLTQAIIAAGSKRSTSTISSAGTPARRAAAMIASGDGAS